MTDFDRLAVGFDIPARPGMLVQDIQTPALILDMDALESNIVKMGKAASGFGVDHRAHGKMHKSVDMAKLQMSLGGAVGICCQKTSEAEVFARGGITDILVSNQVCDPVKIDRLAQLPKLGARILVCVDDLQNISELSAAAQRHDTTLEILIELDCGAGRCGVVDSAELVDLARAASDLPGLIYSGLQAYQGNMQHMHTYEERRDAATSALHKTRAAIDALVAEGLAPRVVTGAGTGSFEFEAASGLYTELQAGSYAVMDADYGRIIGASGARLDESEWRNALFVFTTVMSVAKPGIAVCDAGHKASAIDSGLPTVFGRNDLEVINCTDDHGVIRDPNDTLKLNDKLMLVPGHCDPTCNLHDWYVCVRNGRVETLWPVSARGKGF